MLIKIEIIAVSSPQTIKSYKQIEVTYKDLDKGKVNAKKVMSFSYPEVYNTLSKAEKGDILGIEIKKEGEYWNWVAIGEASTAEAVPKKKVLAPTRVTGGGDVYKRQQLRRLRREPQKPYKELSPIKRLLYAAKKRAKEKGLEFNIDTSDIVIPEICPYLGIPLDSHSSRGTPRTNIYSLDRIDNTRGYVKGNVEVISHLANTMKSNATKEQLVIFSKVILSRYG